MRLQFRARRATSSAGRRERVLDRILFWTRPVVMALSLIACAFWAFALWHAWSWLGIAWAAGVTYVVVWTLNLASDPRRALRADQVAVYGALMLGVALIGSVQLWFLGAGSFDPTSVRFDDELTSSLPASDPPQPLTTVHIAWCALVLAVGPLLRLTLRLLRPWAAREDGVEATRAAMAADEAEKLRVANRLSSASGPGRMTGFEPRVLAEVELLEQPLRHGEPGLGLETMRGRADLVAKGREGERNLAKALQQRGHLDRFATFWSLQMPSETRGAHDRNRGDIDCVIVTGKRILVLDAKALEQGDVTRYTEGRWLYRRDNATGHDIGRPTELKSAHFRAATDALHAQLQRAGAKQRVAAAVVLMPDDAGLGYADRAFWPGGIPAWDLLQLLDELEHEPPFDERSRHSEHVLRVLRALVKDASGAAPTIRSIERETARRIAAERADERREREATTKDPRNAAARHATESRSPSAGRRSTPDSPSNDPYDRLPDQLPF